MSAWGLLKEGNVVGFLQRVWDTVLGHLPAPVATFVQKVLNDEGGVLLSAATTAATDVISGGLTTAAFVKGANDIVTAAETQGVTVAKTDAFAALNLVVGQLQSATPQS